MRKKIFLSVTVVIIAANLLSQIPDWEGGYPEGCTTITVGKEATDDGSVITSHTDDSHRTRSWAGRWSRKVKPTGSSSNTNNGWRC